jgi:hypothetical protein
MGDVGVAISPDANSSTLESSKVGIYRSNKRCWF